MNQLMLKVKDHYVANEIIKLIKKYFINFKKIMKRLQLIVFKCRKKINQNIRAITIYILNDFKHAHSKIYFDFFVSIQKNFRIANLIIKTIKLIKKIQANASFDNDFVESFSITISRFDIFKIDISTSSTRAIVFKFSSLKIVFVTSRKTL